MQLVVNKSRYRAFDKIAKSLVVFVFTTHIGLVQSYPVQSDLYQLNLPEQEAETSLNSLADESDYSLLYSKEDLEGVLLRSLEGSYTLPEALEILLEGTHLNAVVTERGVIVVSSTSNYDTSQENSMNNKSKLSLGILSALGSIFGSGTAIAESDIAANRSLALEEVVVTAQKRQQSIQDASVAVTAISSERMDDGLMGNIEDLQVAVPSVSTGSDFGQAKFFIRGIGLSSSFSGTDPSVAMHVDGAVVSQSFAQLGSFFDLERIEVLRGPQGTLYGRNATGGSVNLITKKPTQEMEGYGRLSAGNFDNVLLEAAISGPLSENVLGRLAFRSEHRSGFGENEFDGSEIDDANKQSLRGHLQLDITEDIDFLLTGEFSTEDDAGLGLKYVDTWSSVDPTVAPAAGLGGYAADRRNVNSEADYGNDKETWSITGTLNWDLSEKYSLKSITNYRELDSLTAFDFDISSVINDDVIGQQFNSEHFSEELQLSYNGDRLSGMVALYYFTEEMSLDSRIGCNDPRDNTLNSDCVSAGGFSATLPFVVQLLGDVDVEAMAVFANASYNLTDSLALNLGGRYSYEDRQGDSAFFVFGNTIPNITGDDFESFTPSVGLEWDVTADILLYTQYSEGFKSGVIQAGNTTPIVEPEEIENFEFGMKGTFFDDRLRVNLAGFSYDFTNLQVSRTVPVEGGGFMPIFENAAKSEGKGLELEAALQLSENFRLDGFVAYLDAEFSDFNTVNPIEPSQGIQSLAGNRTRQSPELTAYLRGEYGVSLQGGSFLAFALEASYKDEQFFTEFNDQIMSQGDYTLINANLKYTSPDEKISANLWVKNLSDEFVYSGMFAISSTRTIGSSMLPPRTYGVTLDYRF